MEVASSNSCNRGHSINNVIARSYTHICILCAIGKWEQLARGNWTSRALMASTRAHLVATLIVSLLFLGLVAAAPRKLSEAPLRTIEVGTGTPGPIICLSPHQINTVFVAKFWCVLLMEIKIWKFILSIYMLACLLRLLQYLQSCLVPLTYY